MNFEDILAMKPGDIFYESEGGYNFECCVLTTPTLIEGKGKYEDGTPYQQFAFEAVNVHDGSIIPYSGTQRLLHYGPRLYTEPQYASCSGRNMGNPEWSFRFVGDETDPHDVRVPAAPPVPFGMQGELSG